MQRGRPLLLTHSRWLTDERPRAYWKTNQAKDPVREELSGESAPPGLAAWWPGPITTFPSLVKCAKELRAQASHTEFWGNGRRDADPKRTDWEFWTIKQVGFECCPHKRMEKSIARSQKQSPGLASKDVQWGHNHNNPTFSVWGLSGVTVEQPPSVLRQHGIQGPTA